MRNGGMAERRSITIGGFSHDNPVPAASQVGPLVMSGLINGLGAGDETPDVRAELDAMFGNVRNILEEAGGHLGHIAKMTIWLKDPADRAELNAAWLEHFPDPDSRPARHTLPMAPGFKAQVQCDFTAYIA
jgi:2-iminobutanoate/2-iminopropanoate deaminase